MPLSSAAPCFFFFNDTATTEIYTLSLHDALPIWRRHHRVHRGYRRRSQVARHRPGAGVRRSEEHTSELQSHLNLVCRLLLEKKNNHRSKSPRPGTVRVVTQTRDPCLPLPCLPHRL